MHRVTSGQESRRTTISSKRREIDRCKIAHSVVAKMRRREEAENGRHTRSFKRLKNVGSEIFELHKSLVEEEKLAKKELARYMEEDYCDELRKLHPDEARFSDKCKEE